METYPMMDIKQEALAIAELYVPHPIHMQRLASRIEVLLKRYGEERAKIAGQQAPRYVPEDDVRIRNLKDLGMSHREIGDTMGRTETAINERWSKIRRENNLPGGIGRPRKVME